jgi:hypothetical protein
MSGAIPPLPNTPSWRGAQLKHRDNFTFTFTLSLVQDKLSNYGIVKCEQLVTSEMVAPLGRKTATPLPTRNSTT